MRKPWTDDEIILVQQMIAEGGNYTDVAIAFGMATATASARCHALGLRSNYYPGSNWILAGDADRAPRYIPRPAPADEPEAIGPIRDLTKHRTCRFIRADILAGEDWRCCGRKPYQNLAYCEYHCAIVYRYWKLTKKEK